MGSAVVMLGTRTSEDLDIWVCRLVFALGPSNTRGSPGLMALLRSMILVCHVKAGLPYSKSQSFRLPGPVSFLFLGMGDK